MIRRIVFGTIILLTLVACSHDLTYDRSASTLVLYADVQSYPGAPPPGTECNLIPALRIWGDQHVIRTIYKDGQRSVLTGQVQSTSLPQLFELLDHGGLFGPALPKAPNPAGTGFTIRVNLKSGITQRSWSTQPAIYIELLNKIDSENLSPFVPQTGLLLPGPYRLAYPSPEQLPEWPKEFGFSLADIQPSGRWIDGAVLAFVWQQLNAGSFGFRDNGKAYGLGLEIAGLSPQDPPFDCWHGWSQVPGLSFRFDHPPRARILAKGLTLSWADWRPQNQRRRFQN